MNASFALKSPVGDFELTPDHDCRMVYIERQKGSAVREIQLQQIPSWCFDPDTIWFYFEAPESEDKATAGEKIKSQLLEEVSTGIVR
ncbi:MAG TPA: hypothetical protein VFG11_01795 [Acidobacteriota bacterium]|nr:hypothetical protein [Acidobacteriota bacterium]